MKAVRTACLWLALTVAPACSAPSAFGFEDTAAGDVPDGWRAAETNGSGSLATWAVRAGARARAGERVLSVVETVNSDQTFNLMLLPDVWPADLSLRVWLRADDGEEDQGGGLMWRAIDCDNYYVARWNPLEWNVRIYEVTQGRRRLLESADVEADARAWHELGVVAEGSRQRVSFDGVEVLALDDDTFEGGGRVGLWTKADAATSFDDLAIRPIATR